MKLNLSENIRMNRKKLDLTQEQLAERLGVSFQSVSRWENGTTVPDLELIVQMTRIFGCTVDELLGCAQNPEKIPVGEIAVQLEEAYRSEDREEILRLLRLIRWEYCEELEQSEDVFVLTRMAYSGAYRIPGVLEEFRLLVKDLLARTHSSSIRADLILTMARIETDEKAGGFIRDNASGYWNLSHDALLWERFLFREEEESFRRMDLILRYRKLCDFLLPGNLPVNAEILENRLAVLSALCPMNPECRGADIWAGIRLRLESACAHAYAEDGRTDDCLGMLEILADRAEALAALPKRGILPCYTPEYADLPLMIRDLGQQPNFIGTEITTVPKDPSRPYDTDGCDWFQLWVYEHELDSGVFDSVREHPRFRKVQERLASVSGRQSREVGK